MVKFKPSRLAKRLEPSKLLGDEPTTPGAESDSSMPTVKPAALDRRRARKKRFKSSSV